MKKKYVTLLMILSLVAYYVISITMVYAGTPGNVNNYGRIMTNGTTSLENKDNVNEVVAAYDHGSVSVLGGGLYSDGTQVFAKGNASVNCTADPSQAAGNNYIGNAKLELVKAEYYVGNQTYIVTENDIENNLVREGDHLVFNSQDGFMSYGVKADVDFDDGNITLPGEATVTMRVVPDYGYQVTSVNGGGYFQAEVTEVPNEVKANSEKVTAGTDFIHQVENGFKIRIKITDDIKGYDNYSLVYVDDNYDTEDPITLTVNGDYLEGVLPHLSAYALMGDNNPVQDEIANPNTGDNIMLYIFLLGLSSIGLLGMGIYLKRRNN